MPSNRSGLNIALWVVQVLLALLYLFAGSAKLMMPAAALQAQTSLPVGLMRFIGVAEVLGGLGLVLQGLLRIWVGLTPLAAACLVPIMIGATVTMVQSKGFVSAVFPLLVGLLVLWIAYARWRVAPLRGRGSE